MVQTYREHAYRLRRSLVCGGVAAREALLDAYLQVHRGGG